MGRNARRRPSRKDQNCYKVCAEKLLSEVDMKGVLLVHGWASNPMNRSRRINHAWLELPPGEPVELADGAVTLDEWYCYDPTTLEKKAVLLRRSIYYALGAIEVGAKFTRAEASQQGLYYRHWGPWDGTCPPTRVAPTRSWPDVRNSR